MFIGTTMYGTPSSSIVPFPAYPSILLSWHRIRINREFRKGSYCTVSAASVALSYSEDACVRQKQCLHLATFAYPVKAKFHNVISILAHDLVEFAAALRRNLQSYPTQSSPSYCMEASMSKA